MNNNRVVPPGFALLPGILAPLTLALALASCGGSNNRNDDSGGTTTTPPATTPPATTPPVTTGGFDTFSSEEIDRSKWSGLELIREVGSLHTVVRQYFGEADSRSSLRFAQSGIDQIAATVKVEETFFDDTTTNDARVRARIFGTWYHAAGVAANGNVGDVFSHIGIQQSVGGTPRIVYFIGQCLDANCNTTATGVGGDLGPATIGQGHALSIAWNGSQFTFGVDGTTTAVTPPDAPGGAPTVEFKFLRSEVQRLDGANEGAAIDASFSSVQVNGAAYDDFSSTRFDPAKWLNGFAPGQPGNDPFVISREVKNGALRSMLSASDGATRSNTIVPRVQGTPSAAAADVTIASSSRIGGSQPRARVAGFWYHSGAASSGNDGDVFAETSLTDTGAGIVARAQVVLCTDASCTTFTQLLDDTTSLGSATPGASRRLGVSWDGQQFTFSADNASVNFAPGAAAPVSGAAQQPNVLIGTRIVGGASGDDAFIDASFDNVDLTSN